MPDDKKPQLFTKSVLGFPQSGSQNPAVATVATSTGSTSTITVAFGPDVWRAPDLPVQRAPSDHKIYNLVGQISSDWSHVEHTLDTIIWALTGVNAEAGACITSQLMGHYGRFRAIVALLTLHERNTQKRTAALTNRAQELQGKANKPGDLRNRIVHDPWYSYPDHGNVTGQFKAMSHKEFKFGVHPRDLEDLENALAAIKKFSLEVDAFRVDVLKMLAETA